MAKIKIRSWLATASDNDWQIAILPHLCVFGGDGAYCLAFGWLTHSIEFWVGNTEDLI